MSLSSSLLPFFFLDDFPAVIGSADRAGVMRLFGAMALRAIVQCRRPYGVVAQPAPGT
jgi:hypothetical protein